MDAQNAAIEKQLRDAAGYDQLQVEWYKKMLQDGSAELWQKYPPKIAMSGATLKKIEDGDRFKTLYETGKSGGATSKKDRNNVENQMFGTNYTLKERKENPKVNPIYGYQKGNGYPYGNKEVVLERPVRDRATYSYEDSLFKGGTAGRYGFPDWTAFTNLDYLNYAKHQGFFEDSMYDIFENVRKMSGREKYDGGYIENQYHGGLSAKDIEKVNPMKKPDAV